MSLPTHRVPVAKVNSFVFFGKTNSIPAQGTAKAIRIHLAALSPHFRET